MEISKEVIAMSKLPWFSTMMNELGYEPVKRGHWERYLNEGLKWRCSECASRFTTPFNYCPHCGAKMTLD